MGAFCYFTQKKVNFKKTLKFSPNQADNISDGSESLVDDNRKNFHYMRYVQAVNSIIYAAVRCRKEIGGIYQGGQFYGRVSSTTQFIRAQCKQQDERKRIRIKESD